MSLSATYALLRLCHFIAIMMVTGGVVSVRWLAPLPFRQQLTQRLTKIWQILLLINLISLFPLLFVQAALLGDGWQDMLNPTILTIMFAQNFGRIWIWQMTLAVIAVMLAEPRPRLIALFLLNGGQLILQAFTGHAVMHEGSIGTLQRVNHALHLFSASAWIGGLPLVLICMKAMRHDSLRAMAISSMLRFSRYAHIAVALVIVSGIADIFFISSMPLVFNTYAGLLTLKILLVMLMVGLAIYNRYGLVPRFSTQQTTATQSSTQQKIIVYTIAEIALAALVLLLVSIFANMEPF